MSESTIDAEREADFFSISWLPNLTTLHKARERKILLSLFRKSSICETITTLQSRPTILILMGVTGSGKTTIGKLLSADLGWNYFDADDFHPAANVEKMTRGIPLDDADREPWLLALHGVINRCLAADQPAVLACSALKKRYRDLLLIDSRVRLVYLKGDSELIRRRLNDRRGHYMNPALLDSQFATLEEPAAGITIDISQSPQDIVTAIEQSFQIERPANP